MAILEGDIKLVTSRVMDDVPEGGGGPTSTEIIDGASNQIFKDVSDVDRAVGVVNLMKSFVSVQTPNTDTLLGTNVIVAEPPVDPNISVTLFSTKETFDTRDQAKSRIESYLYVGGQYPGFLFGNHITGQRAVLMWQRDETIPAIGATMVLTKNEGLENEFRQYVRVTEATLVQRTYTDSGTDYLRNIVTLKISDVLRADFGGFDVSRYEPTSAEMSLKTKISETIVANAAQYAGVVALSQPATRGDFTVRADSIFTQLVPSAQIETPVTDARSNQQSTALVASGDSVTLSIYGELTTTQNFFIGGGVLPGTLTVVSGEITVTDTAGRLFNGGTQVGIVDYENGVLSVLTNVFGDSTNYFDISYTPAYAPRSVNQSQGIFITAENRSTSYVRTIEPPPEKGSLTVSYRSNGNWYILRDAGTGELRGSDSKVGGGTINFSTGAMSVSFGALPDVDTAVIYQWVQKYAARGKETLNLLNEGKLYWPMNSDGLVSTEPGSKPFTPGNITITWLDGTTPQTAVDDSQGNLTGDATGTVDYSRGVLRISPNSLPTKGTTFNVAMTTPPVEPTITLTLVSLGSTSVGNLGATNIKPGSMEFRYTGRLIYVYQNEVMRDWGSDFIMRITDNGSGGLQTWFDDKVYACGTVNYATGDISMTNRFLIPGALMQILLGFSNLTIYDQLG